MPLVRYTLAAAAAALLVGGVAMAQPAMPAGSSPDNNANPPAQDQPTPPPATTSDPSAPMSGSAPMDTATPATGAAANTSADVTSGGVQVIASQPVPDTPANRAKYGQPMSHAGKHTAAKGD